MSAMINNSSGIWDGLNHRFVLVDHHMPAFCMLTYSVGARCKVLVSNARLSSALEEWTVHAHVGNSQSIHLLIPHTRLL